MPVGDGCGGELSLPLVTVMDELSSGIKSFIITEVNPDLHLDGLDDDQPLIEAGIVDSLGVLKILAFLDEQFGIDLSSEGIILENFRTVRTICDMVAKQRGG
jgi:acyl carrier protein